MKILSITIFDKIFIFTNCIIHWSDSKQTIVFEMNSYSKNFTSISNYYKLNKIPLFYLKRIKILSDINDITILLPSFSIVLSQSKGLQFIKDGKRCNLNYSTTNIWLVYKKGKGMQILIITYEINNVNIIFSMCTSLFLFQQ